MLGCGYYTQTVVNIIMRMCETMSARVDQASSAYIGILWLDDYKAI